MKTTASNDLIRVGPLRIYKTVELNVTEQIEEIRSLNDYG
jgi:hypothetical protein